MVGGNFGIMGPLTYVHSNLQGSGLRGGAAVGKG